MFRIIYQKWAMTAALSNAPGPIKKYFRYFKYRINFRPGFNIKLFYFDRIRNKKGQNIPILIHIPKTGGSYTAEILDNSFCILGHSLLRDTFGDNLIPEGLIGSYYKPRQNHFLIATVRNPLYLFRSYYHHVIGVENYNKNSEVHYDHNIALKGFEYLIQEIINRDNKWPSRKFLFPQLFDQSGQLCVDWINFTETLDSDLYALTKYLNKPYTPKNKIRESKKSPLSDYYSDRLIEELSEIYKREFKLFGFNNPYFGNNTPMLHGLIDKSVVQYTYEDDRLYGIGNLDFE